MPRAPFKWTSYLLCRFASVITCQSRIRNVNVRGAMARKTNENMYTPSSVTDKDYTIRRVTLLERITGGEN